MTKCYGHEECEYNGQPECRLPNGMECPHRVKADKPAVKSWLDIEAQIEKLNQYSQSLIAYQMGVEFADVCMDVAAALSTLQAENEWKGLNGHPLRGAHGFTVPGVWSIFGCDKGNHPFRG